MRKTSDSFPIAMVLAVGALTYFGKVIFDSLIYAWLVQELEQRYGVSQATVIAGFAAIAIPLLAAIAVVILLLAYLRREFVRTNATENSSAVAPDTELIRAQAEHIKQRRLQEKQNDPTRKPRQSLVDDKSKELAGIINAMRESAGRYDFRFPLPNGDAFLQHHENLQSSAHPIWTDVRVDQIRREFLNRCHRLGAKEEVFLNAAEFSHLQQELQTSGRYLIAKLLGEIAEPLELPLKEAARIAYEETRGGQFSKSAEGFDGTDNGIIQYYAFHILATATLFGKRPPSTRVERINAQNPRVFLRFVDGHLEGYRNNSTDRFRDLEISRLDLDAAINRIKEIDGNLAVKEMQSN